MGRTVQKYPLSNGEQTIMVPEGAKPLGVGTEQDQGWLYVAADDAQQRVEKKVNVINMGNPVPDLAHYIGSYQVQDGIITKHVFYGG